MCCRAASEIVEPPRVQRSASRCDEGVKPSFQLRVVRHVGTAIELLIAQRGAPLPDHQAHHCGL